MTSGVKAYGDSFLIFSSELSEGSQKINVFTWFQQKCTLFSWKCDTSIILSFITRRISFFELKAQMRYYDIGSSFVICHAPLVICHAITFDILFFSSKIIGPNLMIFNCNVNCVYVKDFQISRLSPLDWLNYLSLFYGSKCLLCY